MPHYVNKLVPSPVYTQPLLGELTGLLGVGLCRVERSAHKRDGLASTGMAGSDHKPVPPRIGVLSSVFSYSISLASRGPLSTKRTTLRVARSLVQMPRPRKTTSNVEALSMPLTRLLHVQSDTARAVRIY